MFLSVFVVAAGSAPLYFLTKENRFLVYPLSAVQGVGLAIMQNTSSSLISDVIGTDSKNSSFVYGCYSLSEKVIGSVIMTQMLLHVLEDQKALRLILAIVPIGCSFICWFFTMIGKKFFGHKLSKITYF